MTWPEVKAALAAGKTTALFYTGGTEQRGPQNVNGGHTLMGREIVRAIALRLGNAIAMPVLPYTPNNASADLPGTIGLTPEILAAILERVSEQAIATGFKNVVIMGDHGGGQPQTYATVAKKLDARKFQLVTISADEPEKQTAVTAFLDQEGVRASRYIKRVEDDQVFIDGIDKQWSGALPALFLYDASGHRIASFIGESDMADVEAAIRKALR